MADPRKFIGYESIGLETITVMADDFGTGTATIEFDESADNGSPQVGLAIMLVGHGEIDLVTNNAPVFGKLLFVDSDGYCTVQVAGGCTLPAGASATVTPGTRIVGALGAASAPGYIKSVAAAGAEPSQAEVNAIAASRGTIIAAADTTKVEVWL